MAETVEELEMLKQERLATIKQHRGHIESLEDEVQRLEGEVEGLQMAIKICSRKADQQEPSGELIGKYAAMELTPAVLNVINESGESPGLLVPEIIKRLTSGGYESKTENLYASVYSVGLRLVKQDKIREGKKGGKRSFTRKASS